MTADPFTRSETIVTIYFLSPQKLPPSVPLVRQQQVDWRALTDAEQLAVRGYCLGETPMALVPERGQTYLRRHHGAAES